MASFIPAKSVNIDDVSVPIEGEMAHMGYLTVSNPAGVKGYSSSTTFGESITATGIVNGGDPYEITFMKPIGQTRFSSLVGDLQAGDTFKVIIELDPAKAGEYRAGTMEQAITIA